MTVPEKRAGQSAESSGQVLGFDPWDTREPWKVSEEESTGEICVFGRSFG